MGFFGDDSGQSEASTLMDEQIRANQAELETKRQNLYSERLDIIKGQGNEVWSPTRPSITGKRPSPAKVAKQTPRERPDFLTR